MLRTSNRPVWGWNMSKFQQTWWYMYITTVLLQRFQVNLNSLGHRRVVKNCKCILYIENMGVFIAPVFLNLWSEKLNILREVPPWYHLVMFNSLRLRQNCRLFVDDIFKCIFLNENVWISLKISLKSVPKVRINCIPALVQVMAWRRPGGKPLSEPMMFSLLTHICVTRPQRVKHIAFSSQAAESTNCIDVTQAS